MDTTKVTRQIRFDTSGDDSVRITAQVILERELKPAFLHGQLSLRLGPRFRIAEKFQGLKAQAFQAGQANPYAPYSLDKIWTSRRRDREWRLVQDDDVLLDHIGSAQPSGLIFELCEQDAVVDGLLAWREAVDDDPPTWPPDEPDTVEWEEAA